LNTLKAAIPPRHATSAATAIARRFVFSPALLYASSARPGTAITAVTRVAVNSAPLPAASANLAVRKP
jgi:hypothetical protein